MIDTILNTLYVAMALELLVIIVLSCCVIWKVIKEKRNDAKKVDN